MATDLEPYGATAQPVKPAPEALAPRALGALVGRSKVRGTLYLLLDHSTSMSDKGRLEQLKRGSVRLFARAREREYAVGAIGFADRAKLLLRPSCDLARFELRLCTLEPDGHTAMAQAIRLATWHLGWRRGDKVILLITDGVPDDREAALEAARWARARGITLIAIGTHQADEAFLAALTPRPELAVKVRQEHLSERLADAARLLPP